ncbi:MAG: hypothetical protein PHV33_13215 [Elusimicrobiales bacterium]|nr:hypothetical protein [Elusimicrobiales bacterium]
MRDYTVFYKRYVNVSAGDRLSGSWDLFISTYSLNERVLKVFKDVRATEKIWLIHPVYGVESGEMPTLTPNERLFSPEDKNIDEAEFIQKSLEFINKDLTEVKLCVDITGFTQPTLIFLLLYLKRIGITKYDVIYSEPDRYLAQENTKFSENVQEVRQIGGCEGKHVTENSDDVLIIGTGYDYALINQVAASKENAKKIKIYGFPSLKADMYQENVFQVQKASEAIGPAILAPLNGYCAPAYDPFVTAAVLRKIFDDLDQSITYSNVYLCPLGTKAQALGFALFYSTECDDDPISIIYPFYLKYAKNDSVGLSGVWQYTIEYN